jgi:hypothetical protein
VLRVRIIGIRGDEGEKGIESFIDLTRVDLGSRALEVLDRFLRGLLLLRVGDGGLLLRAGNRSLLLLRARARARRRHLLGRDTGMDHRERPRE